MSRNLFEELSSRVDWRGFLVGSATSLALSLVLSRISQNPHGGITLSPRATLLPTLSDEEKDKLPYPPDAFPGARDVPSPYGTFRAYEFGPEDGRKVLLIHGISTPCLALGGVAHALADKGCRVMLFDLPGRGYSDTPTDLDHDLRLFTSQILILLASSPLSWTGSGSGGGFSIVGYSLGGGIGAGFTSYFPDLIQSLVLIAPAGIIRPVHFAWSTRILYSKGIIPEPLLLRLVKSRLQKPVVEQDHQDSPTEGAESDQDGMPNKDEKTGAVEAVQAELNVEANQQVVISKRHPGITIDKAVNHQIAHHQGFVPAFMSSIRHGPIHSQHDSWRRIALSLKEKNQKALIVLGERDPVIQVDETQQDASELLQGNVEFVVVDAGHEAPVSKGPEVADHIWKFWNQQT